MSIFEKTPTGIPRKEFKEILRKTFDPTRRLTPHERVAVEKSVFPPSYGEEISKKDISICVKTLKQKKFQTRNLQEKAKIDNKINLLERLKRK